jgi:hypothetical protein
MKSHSFISTRSVIAALCGLILVGTFAYRAHASTWDKQTVLTVNQPIQVQDTYLEPGTYVFRLNDIGSSRHIVQIFDRDQDHLINTIMAIPNYRLEPTGDSRFMFYETPPGTAKAMRAWFYPGDNFGQEFRYPKQLWQLAAAVTPPPALPPEPPPPPVVTNPAETASPTPEPAQAVKEPPKQEEAPLVAQNNPPPSNAQAAPPPETPAQEEPSELPETATPYPLIGLGGLFSLTAYGLLRARFSGLT